MKKAERQAWAARTLPAILATIPPPAHLVFLAGRTYRDPLLPLLQAQGYAGIEVPMVGLGIGQQIRWLMDHSD